MNPGDMPVPLSGSPGELLAIRLGYQKTIASLVIPQAGERDDGLREVLVKTRSVRGRFGRTRSGFRVGVRSVLAVVLFAATACAHAQDYVSVADSAAILYDAPSLKAKKIFVASRYLPLEQVVVLDNWIKVRDSSGGLAWIEKRALSSKRFVVVVSPVAVMRQAPEDKAPVVAQVKQQVALEWLENTGTGWIKVRHLDGVTGYLKATGIWGD